MGRVAFWQADYRRAGILFAQSLQLSHAIGVRIGMMISFEWFGRAAAASGHLEGAAVVLGVAQALRELLGVQIPPSESGNHEHTVTAVCEVLGNRTWSAACAEGLAQPLDEAVAVALEGSTTSG